MNSRISSYFFFVLLLGAAVAAVMIFLPFLTSIVLGAAAAVVTYPIYRRIQKIFGVSAIRDNLSALCTVLFTLIVVLVPVFFLTFRIYSEIQSLYGVLIDESSRSQVIASLNSLSQWLSHSLFDVFPAYSFDSLNVTEYLKDALQWVFANLDTIFGSLTKVIGYVFVFLLALFYFLRDGATIKRRFISWSPLLDEHDEYISRTMKQAVKSVFAGTLAVSLIQGILTGVGFWIFGIPAAAVWGSLAALAALIPGVGTSLVIVPGVIYLAIFASPWQAIGLGIWGAFAVGLIDNLLGPYLINKGLNIHPFLILISVLGGLFTFGPVGFIFGPLILAFLFALLDLYRTSFSEAAKH